MTKGFYVSVMFGSWIFFGMIWLGLIAEMVIKKSISFVQDRDFEYKKLFVVKILDKIDWPVYDNSAVVIGICLVFLMASLVVFVWPIMYAGAIIYGILLFLRKIVRVEKKINRLDKKEG